MKILSREDYHLYKALCQCTQNELLTFLPAMLNKYGYTKVKKTSDYIIAEGTIPILLCAHLDTVGQKSPEEIYYDKEAGVIWSPDLCGADDRAGVFSILKILERNLRPCLCFTTDEEIGGVGAEILSQDGWPYCNLKFILQLDRRNSGEVVYYDMSTESPFCDYIESFGFVEAIGSFSDVCFLAPAFNSAGCNLSVGYVDEHTREERLFVNGLFYTIDRVCKILEDKDSSYFEYIEDPSPWKSYYDNYSCYPTGGTKYICHGCGKLIPDYDAIPAKLIHGGVGYFCANCLDKIDWCEECGSTYEIDPKDPTCGLCVDCKKKAKNNGGSKQKSNKKSDKRSR